jgi:hypothetical protein
MKKERGLMRELNIKTYNVKVKINDNGEVKDKELPYDVKGSLIEILFAKDNQQLPVREAMARDKICKRIEDCESDTILLEDAEWEKLKSSAEKLSFVGRNDVELVSRILDCPEVVVDKVGPKLVSSEK